MLELKVYPMPDTVSTYQQIVTGSMSKSLAGTNRDLLERVNRANAEFQHAGNKLIRMLNELEYLNSSTIS
jgi:hypothetical protein